MSVVDGALIEAARKARLYDMEAAFVSGADVNAGDQYGRSPLHWAAWNGHWLAVKWIIDHGADVNIGTNDWVWI